MYVAVSGDKYCPSLMLPAYVFAAQGSGYDVTCGSLFRGVRMRARGPSVAGVTVVPPSAVEMMRRVADLCDAAGVERKPLHAIRRGCTTDLCWQGLSVDQVRRLAGCASSWMIGVNDGSTEGRGGWPGRTCGCGVRFVVGNHCK